MTATELKNLPTGFFSKSEHTITNLRFFAISPNASVAGPGIDSARLKWRLSFGTWQKYGERNSSGRHTTRAPLEATRSIPAIAFLRFVSGFLLHFICTRPILIFL